MVMRKNIMAKNLRQSILKSIGRYLAIIAIIALGSGIFVGLRTTKTDMVATGQQYMDGQNMFDLRLISTYGWAKEDVDAIARLEGVEDAEGVLSLDAFLTWGQVGDESVYKLYAIPQKVNQVYLLGGRMPQSPDECLVDGSHTTDAVLGATITISDSNDQETLDSLNCRSFTVVGYVSTPLYMDMSRGNTKLGSGSVSSYLYIPEEAFSLDYYTEINITIPGDYAIYSEEYDNAMDAAAEALKPLLETVAQGRYQKILQEVSDAYEDGLVEYNDGYEEFMDGKEQADQELAQALYQLQDGQDEIRHNRELLTSGEQELADARKLLEESEKALVEGQAALQQSKSEAYAQIDASRAELEANRTLVSDGLSQINDGLSQLQAGMEVIRLVISAADTAIGGIDSSILAVDSSIATTQSMIQQARDSGIVPESVIGIMETTLHQQIIQRDQYYAQREVLVNEAAPYRAQLAELETQKTTLEETKVTLEENLALIEAGLVQLEAAKSEADAQFADAEEQLINAYWQIEDGRLQIADNAALLEEGKAELDRAEVELEDGWKSYREGREEAQRELSDAMLELSKAKVELRKGKQTIEDLQGPEVFALTRNTNAGYLSVDSNSDIVAGVSKVFPAFFLLVASLVCITTMTRMVEEERTQIGTLKALGYSNMAIIGKYLAYSGSAAVIGCGLGVLVGSAIFPIILWEAYSLILNLTPQILLIVDWQMCIPVVMSYTAVSMLVTWYCCRMTLREVPAELIRPKPPTSGKKILLEYLPFWDKINFLNKVMLRNIFRYRQRLLMMIVGIGGCTALLLTGFGVKDSIMDIVSIQFDEVTLFDLEARFGEGLTDAEQMEFRQEINRYVDQIEFFHQSSVELDGEAGTQDVSWLVADASIQNFIDFHEGDRSIPIPGIGQALVSAGVAEKLNIHKGDQITLRDPNMNQLTVTVADIYDNHVNNYVVVTPETVLEQWGYTPEIQCVCMTVGEDQDAHYASTKVSEFSGVMSVTVCQDMADSVGSMLEALNLVVVTIVICAGMLAVTVLYNLTNINITERIREIATIKVLGFTATESAAYVFKENLLLSAMGAAVGTVFGYALLSFVMSQIKVDFVWFQARALPQSYVWSVLLTMVSAFVVDFLLYFKLEKINMAEALKSVE